MTDGDTGATTTEVQTPEIPQTPDLPVETPEVPEIPTPPVEPTPMPQTPGPDIPTPIPSPVLQPIGSYLSRALEAIGLRKRAKLDRILQLASKKHSIRNDDVEKLLHVTDTSATNYLNQLVREGKLKRAGNPHQPTYELA